MPDSLPKADKGGHNDLHRIPIAHWWSTKKSLKAVKNTIDEN